MPENENVLSAYIEYHSNISNNLALISGFIFTAMVLLLTLLPDPSSSLAQLTFLILSAVFDLVILQLFAEQELIGYCVRTAPKLPRRNPTGVLNKLSLLVWVLLGVVRMLMFLVLGLVYLAAASVVMFTGVGLFGYVKIVKRFLRWQQWKRIDLYIDES